VNGTSTRVASIGAGAVTDAKFYLLAGDAASRVTRSGS
jgi:hypothetical protein